MKDPNDPGKPLPLTRRAQQIWRIIGALACGLFGALIALGVLALWQLDSIPITSTFNEQMMQRKTRTMEEILDGLVRGNMRRVEDSAEHMKSIGVHVDWYSTREIYENNNDRFRQSTLQLIDAARDRDHDAAKEAALRLERSCIECHALINRNQFQNQ